LGIDYANPRAFFKKLEEGTLLGQLDLTVQFIALCQRLNCAHLNALEAFGPYAGAILACYLTKVPAKETDDLAKLYILIRIAYLISFVLIDREPYGPIRSLIWHLSTFIILWLYWKALKSHLRNSAENHHQG